MSVTVRWSVALSCGLLAMGCGATDSTTAPNLAKGAISARQLRDVRHLREATARRTSGDELVLVDVLTGTNAGATGTHLSYERLHLTGPGPHDFEEVASLELDIPSETFSAPEHGAWQLHVDAGFGRGRVDMVWDVQPDAWKRFTGEPIDLGNGWIERVVGQVVGQQTSANGSIFGDVVGANAPEATSLGEVFREHSVRVITRKPRGT